MSINPLVSVLMTSYNREDYIAFAIQSVLASTYKNIELIIVDDGSKDNTIKIARSFAATDDRVKIFINEKNLGDYPNRNMAASHAKGEYLKYVDADDLIYPHGLEILVNSMLKFPKVGWGLCTMQPDPERVFPLTLDPKEAYEYHYLGNGLFDKAPLSAIIKRELFNQVGGFKPIRMAGDHEMWHRLAQSEPLVLIQGGIIWYRIHESQEMADYHKYKKVYREIGNQYLKDPNCPMDQKMVKRIFNRLRRHAIKEGIKSILNLNFGNLMEEMRFFRSI